MREATGELNTSVIVFIAVALLAAFFFMVIWPIIRKDMNVQSSCANAICDVGYNSNYMVDCYSPGDKSRVFQCPFKG
ncbi:MAG: hypothetical protein IKQ29_02305 [Bacilli bacterium]|nr:hypothetical protein [Bacilli bacterium]